MNVTLRVTILLLCIVALTACSSSDPTTPGGGNLRIYLTDKPMDLDTVSAVNVTISGLTLYDADGNGVPLDILPALDGEEVTVNLLDYRDGKVILLVSETVPEGDYDKIRMDVLEAHLLRDDDGDPETPDLVEDIFLPSGKVKVVVPSALTVVEDEETEVTLDFDADLSIHLNETQGNHPYILRPVINVVQ